MKLEKINLALKLPIGWLFSLTKKKKKIIILSTDSQMGSVSCIFVFVQRFIETWLNIGVTLPSPCPLMF